VIFPVDPNTPLVVSATLGANQTFTNIQLTPTGGGSTQTFTTNPASVGALTGPVTVTGNCTASTTLAGTYIPGSGNSAINLNVKNTGAVNAANARITAIGNVTAAIGNTIIFDQGVVGNPNLTLPWIIGSPLGAGVTTSATLGFRATSGTTAVPFTFVVTLQADNASATNVTISVPFPR
jgi:hypothetical protein